MSVCKILLSSIIFIEYYNWFWYFHPAINKALSLSINHNNDLDLDLPEAVSQLSGWVNFKRYTILAKDGNKQAFTFNTRFINQFNWSDGTHWCQQDQSQLCILAQTNNLQMMKDESQV
jgi:hypothetical protein